MAAVMALRGVGVDLCPPRHGNRKGVVEKANHTAAQRWWRTLGDESTTASAENTTASAETTTASAKTGLDELCVRLDGRARRRDGERTTVGALAVAEGLRAAPTVAYPAELAVVRTVSAQALVPFCGNRYSVPPGMPGAQVMLLRRLGVDELRIVTAAGATVALHHAASDGAGAVICD